MRRAKTIFLAIALTVIVIAYLGGRASATANYYSPPNGYSIVDQLSKGDNESFLLISDETVFDARPRSTSVPRNDEDRVRLAVMTDTMVLKRTGRGHLYSIPYSTLSKAGLELKSTTHPYRTEVVRGIGFSDEGGESGLGIVLDLESIPIGSTAEVKVVGYYWNAYSTTTNAETATYTDPSVEGLNNLVLDVILPDDHVFRSYRLFERHYEGNRAIDRPIDSAQATLVGAKHKLHWKVRNPSGSKIYRIVFDW